MNDVVMRRVSNVHSAHSPFCMATTLAGLIMPTPKPEDQKDFWIGKQIDLIPPEFECDAAGKITLLKSRDELVRENAEWQQRCVDLRELADLRGDHVDWLRRERDHVVEGVKHALAILLEHTESPMSVDELRNLRHHLMGTITDTNGHVMEVRT
jgi:hypothetical protein